MLPLVHHAMLSVSYYRRVQVSCEDFCFKNPFFPIFITGHTAPIFILFSSIVYCDSNQIVYPFLNICPRISSLALKISTPPSFQSRNLANPLPSFHLFSLTSCLCKLFELLVLFCLKFCLESNHLFCSFQAAFDPAGLR